MNVVLIEYGAGNTQSVFYALQRLGVEPKVTKKHEDIQSADRVIFPGVGAAGYAMQQLRNSQLDILIPQLKNPVLGICLGMQIMCANSEEGNINCLGIFNVPVVRFSEKINNLKVPHMGWNNTESNAPDFNNKDFYFVHSYYVPVCNETIATTRYGVDFSAVLRRENFTGVQFHPEKSANEGAAVLKNFLK
jgi:glutamine amidotransferase